MKKVFILTALILLLMGVLISCAQDQRPTISEAETTSAPTEAELTMEEARAVVTEGRELAQKLLFGGMFVVVDGQVASIEFLDHTSEEIAINGVERYRPVLSSTGFSSVSDVRNALLCYFTEEAVEAMLIGNDGGSDFPRFVDYNGRLYYAWEMGYPAIYDWNTAIYTLIESEGSHDIFRVEVAEIGCKIFYTFYLTFVEGRMHRTDLTLE